MNNTGITLISEKVLLFTRKLFPVYWFEKWIVRKKYNREKSIDYFIIVKVLLIAAGLLFRIYQVESSVLHYLLLFILIYLEIETLSTILLKILHADKFPKPYSYSRTSLLILLNYVEITLGFALIYSFTGTLFLTASGKQNMHPNSTLDYVYFSVVTSVTMGSGDYSVSAGGKIIVMIQVFVFMLFLSLFLSYNFSNLKNTQL